MENQCHQFTVSAFDQMSLFVRAWLPVAKEVQGLVWLVHGFGEHSGRYSTLAQTILDKGFAVIGYDHRGHGQSGGRRGCAPNYDAFLKDLNTVRLQVQAQSWFKSLPAQALGRQVLWSHSFGGGLALNYLLRAYAKEADLPEFQGYLVTSPWLRLAEPPHPMLVNLARFVHWFYPAFVLSSKLDPERISSDPDVQRDYAKELADPAGLLHGKISYQLFSGAVKAGEYVLAQASLVNGLGVPIRLVHGASDQVTSAQASCQFAELANEGATSPLVALDIRASMRHETHNEVGRNSLIADNLSWVMKVCGMSGL